MQSQKKRLIREVERLKSKPPQGISVYPKSDSKIDELSVGIIGPTGSPYEGGLFNLEVQVPDRYPFEPPHIKFLTPVYHPNIDNNGLICLDLLKMPPKGSWRPTYNLENLFEAVQALLGNPNPDDPLMPEIAEEFTLNRAEYERKARECALQAKKKRKRDED